MANSRFSAKQLARKLKLEATLRPQIMGWFNMVNAAVRAFVRSTGTPPPMAIFRDDLTTILRRHYMRVAREFRGDVHAELTKAMGRKQAEDVTDAVLAAVLAWAAENAVEQSGTIISTTESDLRDIVTEAQAQEPDNNIALAALIAAALAATFPGRADTIIAFETQTAAELAKYIEAEAVAGVGEESVKVWHTTLDARTRFSHVLANLQEKPRTDPFVVNGERLKVPGDSSLGASLSNLINCRCSAEYRKV